MHLVEFIVQGVRQFPSTLRLSLTPGYNALFSAPDGRAEVLFKVLHALFYQPALDGKRADLVEPGAQVSRGGVTLVGRDGRSYRLLRDFLAGAVSLSVDNGQGAFTTLSSTGQEVEQLLSAQVGLVSEDVYRVLLSTALSDMPSRATVGPIAGLVPAGAAPSMMPGAAPGMMPGAGPGMVPGGYPPGMQGYPPGPPSYPGAIPPGMGPSSYPGTIPPGMGPPSYPGAMAPGMGPPSYPGAVANPYAQPAGPGAYWGQAPVSPFAHLSEDEKRAKLTELQQHRKSADALRSMEFEVDGLQRRKFEIEDELRPFRDAMQLLDDARAKLQPFVDIEDIPPDFINKLDWFRREQQKRDQNIKTLDTEFRRERALLARGTPRPLLKEPLFLGGLAGGVLAFGLGTMLARSVDPAMWWIALLDTVGFGAAGLVLLRRISDDEAKGDTARAERKLDERKSRVLNRFELDTTAVRKILLRHNVDQDELDPLEIRLNRRLETLQEIASAEVALHGIEGQSGIDAIALNEELHQLEQQVAQAEDHLAKAGAVQVDMAELTSQIHQLEAELGVKDDGDDAPATLGYDPGYGGSGPDQGGGVPPIQASANDSGPGWRCAAGDDGYGMGGTGDADDYGGGGGAPPAPPAAAVVIDQSRLIMEKADSLFCTGIAALGARVSARLVQFLGAFTEQRFSGVQFGERGDLSLIEAQSGRAVPFLMLAPPDRDVAYLCLKFTLLEAHVQLSPIPAILNDPFVALAELRHPLAMKMLQFISTQMQIVHLTSLEALAPEGAGRIPL
ncbi:MAG: hypothetical protein ABIJ09_19405 [Pseudomonadota bacterium]